MVVETYRRVAAVEADTDEEAFVRARQMYEDGMFRINAESDFSDYELFGVRDGNGCVVDDFTEVLHDGK